MYFKTVNKCVSGHPWSPPHSIPGKLEQPKVYARKTRTIQSPEYSGYSGVFIVVQVFRAFRSFPDFPGSRGVVAKNLSGKLNDNFATHSLGRNYELELPSSISNVNKSTCIPVISTVLTESKLTPLEMRITLFL